MQNTQELEDIITKCLAEMETAALDRYETDKADRTAALFLVAQMKISLVIEDIELKAKQSKNEVERLEGQKYLEIKNQVSEKKITENAIQAHIVVSDDIYKAKQAAAEYEANLKKLTFLFNTLKDGHIYFRNTHKTKQWAE